MLLIHGDNDHTVPFTQSELMAEALKKAGVDMKLIVLHGGHVFAEQVPQHPEWVDPLDEPSRWLDQHLKKPATGR